MPPFLKTLSFVGMVAMLWVGGAIIIHGLYVYGIDGPEHVTHVIGDAARTAIPLIGDLLAWLASAIASAVLGLVIGAITALAVVPILTPLWRTVRHA
jgi:predicted DNA repair protein MutK